jgi:hypothetical protein
MQPHAKSIHLVIVNRSVPDLRRKTITFSGIFRAGAIRAWFGCAGVGLPLALAARAALIEPARNIGFLPETKRGTARS